jgi:hypothetical protein
MRCLLPQSKAPVVGTFVSVSSRNSHTYPADVGEGSGDDSGDEGERPTKDDEEDEEEDDAGNINSPVGHSHSTRIYFSFPFAV